MNRGRASVIGTMAHAVVAPEYGEPSVLSIVDVDVPAPEAGKVTVQMKAVGMLKNDEPTAPYTCEPSAVIAFGNTWSFGR